MAVSHHKDHLKTMMLSSRIAGVARRRVVSNSIRNQVARAQSTQVEKTGEDPIAEDGRHEVWREDIYEHDNEPK